MTKNTNTFANEGATAVGHKNVFTAVTTAIYDTFSNKCQLEPINDDKRIDGKICLVTGANSGLGKSVAIALAKRGGHVIMACRGGHPDAGDDVRKASGSDKVEMIKVDLSDLNSVHALCDTLRDRNITLDITVSNAGLMPLNARKSPQGFELMFAVHFLANRVMTERWLKDGVIKANSHQEETPRIIFVSSEAHQSSDPIDFENFGAFTDYGLKDGLGFYGLSKLHLCTFVNELSKRTNEDDKTSVAIHSLCPGPIASNIAKESPAFLKPILGPIMKLFFNTPEKAAEPVILLACADDMGQRSGAYLHMMREKKISALASCPENGRKLWEHSAQLLAPYTPATTAKVSAKIEH
jgi:NAD(P)-dependent dehydrogenase (short-subunit alcohol dehydrogenase family)